MPDNEAVVELIARAIVDSWPASEPWECQPLIGKTIARDNTIAILSALSDAGLAPLPLEANVEMVRAARANGAVFGFGVHWSEARKAFHPSQLEKTDE